MTTLNDDKRRVSTGVTRTRCVSCKRFAKVLPGETKCASCLGVLPLDLTPKRGGR